MNPHAEEIVPPNRNEVQSIEPYLPGGIRLSPDGMHAAGSLLGFVFQSNAQVMVIDGSAGTGKTSLIAGLVSYLRQQKRKVVLLASTGRAAKVLADKARYPAETIHKHIYILEVQEINHIQRTNKLVFKLRENFEPEDAVYVVDESSMVSDHPSKGQFLHFGTGRLLGDLLKFVGERKIIFVGDKCQLPPVNVAFPPVFESQYFEQRYNLKTIQLELHTQYRFGEQSGIFAHTNQWRNAIQEGNRQPLLIDTNYSDLHVISDAGHMAGLLAKRIRSRGIDACIGICFSNQAAFNHSQAVRIELFKNAGTLNIGEVLIVMHNNYTHNLTNGEHIIVERIGNTVRRAGLTFRAIEARLTDFAGQRKIKAFFIEEFLYTPAPSLSNEQETSLTIDFYKRTREKGIKDNSEEFFSHQLNDPYLNALRLKFGYVITCHKAQGGEWEDVFIDFENSLLMNKPEFYLRWAYTALSRSSQNVFLLKKSFVR